MPAKTKTKAKPKLSASRSATPARTRKAAPSSRSASRGTTPAKARKAAPGNRSASLPRSKRLRSSSSRSEALTTTDLAEIRQWAEARQGKPATVKTKGKGQGAGILRIDFPGYSGKDTLQPISWEEWYQKFQEKNLAFLYQEKTKTGKESRFFKLVNKS